MKLLSKILFVLILLSVLPAIAVAQVRVGVLTSKYKNCDQIATNLLKEVGLPRSQFSDYRDAEGIFVVVFSNRNSRPTMGSKRSLSDLKVSISNNNIALAYLWAADALDDTEFLCLQGYAYRVYLYSYDGDNSLTLLYYHSFL